MHTYMSQISKRAIHLFKNLINTYTQIKHIGWRKKTKKNKRTATSIRDTRVHTGTLEVGWLRGGAWLHPSFQQTSKPNYNQGSILCPPNYYCPPKIFERAPPLTQVYEYVLIKRTKEIHSEISSNQKSSLLGLLNHGPLLFWFMVKSIKSYKNIGDLLQSDLGTLLVS